MSADAAPLAVVPVPFEIATPDRRIDYVRAVDPAKTALDALVAVRDGSLAAPVAGSKLP